MNHSSRWGPSRIGNGARRAVSAATLFLVLSFVGVAGADETREETAERQIAFGVELAPHGLWREALYRWQRALELDPNNAKARNNLAVAYEQSGQFELAEEHYRKAVELAPDNTYIRQNYELFREANERRRRKSKSQP